MLHYPSMQILLTIIAFLVIFSALILIHECGHFFMARRHGIKVEEFGFGLPPRAFGKKIGEVLYSFNWIPLVDLFGCWGRTVMIRRRARISEVFVVRRRGNGRRWCAREW